MDLDRFLVKPLEVEILGEKVMLKPLTTSDYPLITQLAWYDGKILEVQKKLNPGEELEISKIYTAIELKQKSELEKEIVFKTLKQIDENLTLEKFDQLPMKVIQEVMVGALKVNGFTDENILKAKNLLLSKNDQQNKRETK